MFYNARTGFCFRHVLYIVAGAVALALVVLGISYPALAGHLDDSASNSVTVAVQDADSSTTHNIQIIEEIDLGEQGIFPADHILATIHVDGQVYTVDTFGKSVDELLALYGFTLSNEDYTEQVANEYGYDLYINRKTVTLHTEEVTIPYETVRVADDSMMEGKEVVTTAGVNGQQTEVYETVVLNGETTTTLVSTEVTTKVVNEVITYGTKKDHSKPTGFKKNNNSLNRCDETVVAIDEVNKTFTLSNGDVVSYEKKLSCKAYSYCLKGITATGTTAREGAIAVDPKVIPLGSKLFIITETGSVVYGYATAEDTGGGIKGHKVDLYYNEKSTCYQFGTRQVMIFILD